MFFAGKRLHNKRVVDPEFGIALKFSVGKRRRESRS